jgi:HK97 family phage major capsid protein
VAGGQLVRLDERYAERLQVGFFAFARADGVVQDGNAAKFLVQP